MARSSSSVTTNAASSVAQFGATLNASVNPNGSDATVAFQYGTTTGYGTSASVGSVGAGSSAVAASKPITGLACGTLYHFRATATNAGGTTNGSDSTFTTSACSAPTVTTNAG